MKYTISKETKDPNYKSGAPFHGDKIFIEIISKILDKVDYFIETGTAYGDTLKFVIDNLPNVKSISCEPDNYRHDVVKNYIPNAEILQMTSPQILEYIKSKYPDSLDKKCIFWLDAHGDFNGKIVWPLREEIEFIKNNFKEYYILVDDFKNPYNSKFKFDVVGIHDCGIDYISDLVKDLNVYYPNYNELTSEAWPELIGWVLITNKKYGHEKLILHR